MFVEAWTYSTPATFKIIKAAQEATGIGAAMVCREVKYEKSMKLL
jgi:hypothetical protein